MKLKTLNELKEDSCKIASVDEPTIYGFSEILKQEAIKWVREFQIERTRAISEMFDDVDKDGIYPTSKFFNRIDGFWMRKFNIIEEDLI